MHKFVIARRTIVYIQLLEYIQQFHLIHSSECVDQEQGPVGSPKLVW